LTTWTCVLPITWKISFHAHALYSLFLFKSHPCWLTLVSFIGASNSLFKIIQLSVNIEDTTGRILSCSALIILTFQGFTAVEKQIAN
jgi:hypothetical protein